MIPQYKNPPTHPPTHPHTQTHMWHSMQNQLAISDMYWSQKSHLTSVIDQNCKFKSVCIGCKCYQQFVQAYACNCNLPEEATGIPINTMGKYNLKMWAMPVKVRFAKGRFAQINSISMHVSNMVLQICKHSVLERDLKASVIMHAWIRP